jgi:hypothetical protein
MFRVEYIHTSKVLADGLTKVFEGKEFIFFCDNLLGIKQNNTTGGRWNLCTQYQLHYFV